MKLGTSGVRTKKCLRKQGAHNNKLYGRLLETMECTLHENLCPSQTTECSRGDMDGWDCMSSRRATRPGTPVKKMQNSSMKPIKEGRTSWRLIHSIYSYTTLVLIRVSLLWENLVHQAMQLPCVIALLQICLQWFSHWKREPINASISCLGLLTGTMYPCATLTQSWPPVHSLFPRDC